MQRSYTKSFILFHFIVVIYGFTAIIGKLIHMNALQMVWYRMLFAAISLFIFLKWRKINLSIAEKDILKLIGIGLVVAFHWITFFGAIKIANISVTLGIMASGTLFASILEPIFFKQRINWLEFLIGIGIVLGLYLIFSYEIHYIKGILVAILSSILATLFTILNKSYTHKFTPTLISFYEMTGGFIGITIYLLASQQFNHELLTPSVSDVIYMLLLGVICTAFAFAVSVDVMKELSAYNILLAINMEPVYGIMLAYFIFGESEYMSGGFYIGTIVILLSVFLYPMVKARLKREKLKSA
ncbi:DMT family transporter [Plebeiibacterium sediminum]|uniref:DMT family transporter n=1 Tax=Plebeiibacterium sediminum TaxID=2992112 RepID=A0AAE3M1I6_9BACT|nr:EamA family transporter [Plebeiobacterium sediminum]MCW3785211.1 DMT family transporter [Plebeiobacterium sediminum]